MAAKVARRENIVATFDARMAASNLTKLGLHSVAATFEAEADRAAKSERSFTAYLGRRVELELADKAERSINARIARARSPGAAHARAVRLQFPAQPLLEVGARAEEGVVNFWSSDSDVGLRRLDLRGERR